MDARLHDTRFEHDIRNVDCKFPIQGMFPIHVYGEDEDDEDRRKWKMIVLWKILVLDSWNFWIWMVWILIFVVVVVVRHEFLLESPISMRMSMNHNRIVHLPRYRQWNWHIPFDFHDEIPSIDDSVSQQLLQ
jgi:hypothetical protein